MLLLTDDRYSDVDALHRVVQCVGYKYAVRLLWALYADIVSR